MPMSEYYCDKCEREVQLTLTIREHDKGPIKCPKCGCKALRPVLSTFTSQTSKKSLFQAPRPRIPRALSHPWHRVSFRRSSLGQDCITTMHKTFKSRARRP